MKSTRDARLAALEKERSAYSHHRQPATPSSALDAVAAATHRSSKLSSSARSDANKSADGPNPNASTRSNPFRRTHVPETARDRERRLDDERELRHIEEKRAAEDRELQRLQEEQADHEREMARNMERERILARSVTAREKIRVEAEQRQQQSMANAVRKARDAAKSATAVDAWSKLLENEKQTRSKYYETPRSLLLMLEEERTKNLQLENDYQLLLNELDVTKEAYNEKLKDLQNQREQDVRTLQKTLLEKSEECTSLTKKLGQATTKHADDVIVWSARTEKLDNQLARIQATLQETESRVLRQDKAIMELTANRKIMQEKINQRELELKKYMHLSKDKDNDWMEEKESRMRLEVKVLEVEHVVSQRDETIATQRAQIQKLNADMEKVELLRAQIDQLRQETQLVSASERTYKEELDKAEARERKAASDMETMALHQRKLLNEIDLFGARERTHLTELAELRQSESKLKDELAERMRQNQDLNNNVLILSKRERKQVGEYKALEQELAQVQRMLEDTVSKLREQRDEMADVQRRAERLALERDTETQDRQRAEEQVREHQASQQAATRRVAELEGDLEVAHKQLAELRASVKDKSHHLENKADDVSRLEREMSEQRRRIAELTASLEAEHRIKDTMKSKYADTIASLNGKLDAASKSLTDVQLELHKSQASESHLRDTLHHRERQNDTLNEKVAELTAALGQEMHDLQKLRTRKNDEMSAVHDQLAHAQATFDSESASLREALQQKSQQVVVLTEQLTQLNVVHTQLSADRNALEAQFAELQESHREQAAAVKELSAALATRDRDLELLAMRYTTTLQSVSRLEDDIKDFRKLGTLTDLSPIKPPRAKSHSPGASQPQPQPPPLPTTKTTTTTTNVFRRSVNADGDLSTTSYGRTQRQTEADVSQSIGNYDDGNSSSLGDVTRLTSNVTGLTRRLQEQVEALGVVSKTNSQEHMPLTFPQRPRTTSASISVTEETTTHTKTRSSSSAGKRSAEHDVRGRDESSVPYAWHSFDSSTGGRDNLSKPARPAK
ncbi:hypothetical protein RI367_005382 [Sorochytrium milnesiophthora]